MNRPIQPSWLALSGAGWICSFLAALGQAPAPDTHVGAATPPAPVRHQLHADAWWLLDLPDGRRFDASGLLRNGNGELWTLNDQSPGIYRLVPDPATRVAKLSRIPEMLTTADLRLLGVPTIGRFDAEGMAMDATGRLYLCEEGSRRIVRREPASGEWRALTIDWSPVSRFFHPTDRNASFEGVAVGGNRLYVANERQQPRILVVDLASETVVDDFAVLPAGSIADDAQYSDLCWAEESLWILVRDARCVLRVDPASKTVLAEFDYASLETARATAYGSFFAPGFMEGLWVERDAVWLLTDNNGFGRRADLKDPRPTLFRCPRPEHDP